MRCPVLWGGRAGAGTGRGECAGEVGRRLTPQAFAAATLPLLEEVTAELAAAAEAVEEADAASTGH